MANYIELNTRLVEEFGNLERICSQIYNDKHGVTCYINDMLHMSATASYLTDNWDYDLNYLKNIREKRNFLSHGEVLFSEPCATADEIAYTIAFKNRIFSQTDPLCLYRKKSEQLNSVYSNHQAKKAPVIPNNKKSGCLSLFIAAITIFIIATMFLIK